MTTKIRLTKSAYDEIRIKSCFAVRDIYANNPIYFAGVEFELEPIPQEPVWLIRRTTPENSSHGKIAHLTEVCANRTIECCCIKGPSGYDFDDYRPATDADKRCHFCLKLP